MPAGTTPIGADTVPPTIALTTPAALAAGLTGTLAISARARETTSVSRRGWNSRSTASRSARPTRARRSRTTLETSDYPAGQHVVRARAADAAGNVSAWSTAQVQFGGSVAQPRGFTRNETWITGLDVPPRMAQAPDGRIFVAQQGGRCA